MFVQLNTRAEVSMESSIFFMFFELEGG